MLTAQNFLHFKIITITTLIIFFFFNLLLNYSLIADKNTFVMNRSSFTLQLQPLDCKYR